MRVARLRAWTLAPLAVAAALGCEQIIGADFGDKPLARCDSAQPPSPPESAADGAGVEMVSAVYSMEWGEELLSDGGQPAYQRIGFDLDDRCTSVFDPPPCRPAAWTDGGSVDGLNGIDNGVGALLYAQAAVFNSQPFNSAFLTERVQSGAHAPLAVFHVTGYNGFFADEHVRVELLVPMPLGKPPAWDGDDAYLIDPSSATAAGDGGVVARFVDDAAYVSGFQLVAHFGASEIRLANVVFSLLDAVLVAHVQPSAVPGVWALSGTLAGHGGVDSLLALLPALTNSFPGHPVCRDQGIYDELKPWLCAEADSLISRGPGGPGVECDAVSFGVAIDTRPVKIAGVAAVPDGGPFCDAATDPANDTCARP